MGFSLLAPLFLAGLAAIAVPIYVHLTHRERKEPVRFPSLMFLRRIPFRTTKRQRIRHWWLFLLRIAAIALVVVAFSRPLLDRGDLGVTVLGSAREVVILLDRSLSMTYGDRWQHAVEAVEEIANGVGQADRATLMVFAERATALTGATNDPQHIRAALATVEPGGGRTRIGSAVRLARDALETSELPVRQVVLISDFQAIGAVGPDDDRLPAGTEVSIVDVAEGEIRNFGVTAVELQRVGDGSQDRITVTARLANRGRATGDSVLLELAIDNQVVAEDQLAVSVGELGVATLRARVPAGRQVLGEVRGPADEFEVDNVFRFVVAPEPPLSVLVLGDPRGGRDGLYLDRALALGEDPPFSVTSVSAARATEDMIRGADVVIMNDAPFPGGGLGRALRAFVERGGGLWAVFGRRNGGGAWSDDGVALVGSAAGPLVDRVAGTGATMSVLRYDHPLFVPFAQPRSGDFSAVRFFRYRRHVLADDAVALARFDDGAVALAEVSVGEGRVLTWTAGLANEWNDLPLMPVFLPFVHEAIRYLARYHREPAWRTAGSVLGDADLQWVEGEPVLERPDGSRVSITDGGPEAVVLDVPGWYAIRSASGGERRAIAVNADPTESDLSPGDPEEIAAGIAPLEGGGRRVAELAAALTPEERERRQGVWWYLLLTALLLSIVESGLARRAGRVAR